jgi:hypothetical protein
MLPADTFHFDPPDGVYTAYGEVEPFVFTLPLSRPRPIAFRDDPAGAAEEEFRLRSARVPFPLLVPTYLPAGYELLRIRAARDRWLDAYWVQPRTGAVIQLVERQTVDADRFALGRPIKSDVGDVTWYEVRRPRPIQYLQWRVGSTHLSLSAAGIDRAEALRIAASLRAVRSDFSSSAEVDREAGEGVPSSYVSK